MKPSGFDIIELLKINQTANVDKRTIGYKRRKLSMEKGTSAMLSLLETAKKAVIPAK